MSKGIYVMKGRTPFSQRVRDGMVSAMEVPCDLARGDTLLTLTGHSHAVIENFRRLLKCSECEMIVLGKSDTLTIQGKRLQIDHFRQEELAVTGQITGIRIESR